MTASVSTYGVRPSTVLPLVASAFSLGGSRLCAPVLLARVAGHSWAVRHRGPRAPSRRRPALPPVFLPACTAARPCCRSVVFFLRRRGAAADRDARASPLLARGSGLRRSPASTARTSAVGPPAARGTAEGRARGPPWRPPWAPAEEQAQEVRGPRTGQPLCSAFGPPCHRRSHPWPAGAAQARSAER